MSLTERAGTDKHQHKYDDGDLFGCLSLMVLVAIVLLAIIDRLFGGGHLHALHHAVAEGMRFLLDA